MKRTQCSRLAGAVLAFVFSVAALADFTSTATMTVQTFLNLTNGSTSINGADVLWGGTTTEGSCPCALSFQTAAKGYNMGAIGSTAYAALTQSIVSEEGALMTPTPIPSSSLVVGDVFVVEGNTGNFTKAMVTADSGGTLSFQYDTFGVSSTGTPSPTITGIYNGSSKIPAGFPNSGISASTLFAIEGANMADPNAPVVNQDSTQGLPTTLNGATVTVTVGGKTFTPALYHALSYEIAGVLPAATPTGTATVTVAYGGQTAAAQVQIVPSAYGIDNYNGNTAVITDAVTYAVLSYTSSAKPGEYVTVWGTGLGSDPLDSDTTSNGQQHAIPTAVQVWLGGVQATNVTYAGEGFYPGVHIVIFQVPSNVPTGCFIPVAVVTGSGTSAVVSNTPTIPIMPNGGVCNDSYTGLSGSQISSLQGQSTVNYGIVSVGQSTSPGSTGSPTTSDFAIGVFEQVSGANFGGSSSGISVGTCTVNEAVYTAGSTTTITGLNAGTITVMPPGGSAITLQALAQGEYEAQLPSGAIPSSGGTFAFNGTGASGSLSVGPFSTTVNFPNPLLNWTNQSASATVTRTAGQSYTWTGGAAGTYVIMNGTSVSASLGISGSYTCIAPVSAGQFTVPAYILLALPAGTGTSDIENTTALTSFTASGLNYGYAEGYVSYSANTTYQ